jgi:hypothetical protein
MMGRVADPVLAPPGRETGTPDVGSVPGDGLLEFALRVARGSIAERLSFHSGYRSVAVDPGIDHVEVITELRRLVLLAEIHAGPNGSLWRDARAAAEALAPYRGRLTLEACVRFHPQQGYTSLPSLDVHLGGASTMQPASDVRVEPIHAAGPAPPGGVRPIVGALVEATFPAPTVRGVHTLVIHVDHTYLLLATIDLMRMP